MVRWGVALTSFTLKVFFIFWSTGIAFDQFYFEDGDQNIASNPRYRGISQTRSFAICSDYILYLFRLYLIFVQIIFYICSDFFLGPCMFNEHCSFWWYHHLQHYVLISLTICWDFYLNIWWKGSALRTTAAATDKRLGHMFKCLCLYFTPNIVKLLSLHWLFNVTGVETILHR